MPKKDNRRERNRRLILKYKKGKVCVNCGLVKPLTFHHKDPKQKSFALSKASRLKVSLEKLKEEIDKCTLLCEECHCLEHNDVIMVPPGWPEIDFTFYCLTNRKVCVIIKHEPTGVEARGSHGTSRRIAHNNAWKRMALILKGKGITV